MKWNAYTAWRALRREYNILSRTHMRDLFDADKSRREQFHLESCGLYLDYSKNLIRQKTMDQLCQLANAHHLSENIRALFQGNYINLSENVPVLHTALRRLDGDVPEPVQVSWEKIKNLSERVNADNYYGYNGKPITDVIHIGVGGSALGPYLLYHALKYYQINSIKCHFIFDEDSMAALEILNVLNPETTLVIVVSKSFNTTESLDHAHRVKRWMKEAAGNDSFLNTQFIAITEKIQKARDFGILEKNIFPLWSWISGRFSIWSAVSLSVILTIGWDNFREFLRGAYEMDQHFETAELSHNMPVILALLSIWYSKFFKTTTHAIIPYNYQLRHLLDYLKQLHMESHGKCVQRTGKPVIDHTGSIIWGGGGTECRHSFYQLLLQGTILTPVDFILSLKNETKTDFEWSLIANCFSQSETLMRGYSIQNRYQQIRGNNPSNLIMMQKISPYTVGALLALYEHKVYVQSVIWNINAFDQWGVEQAKHVFHQKFSEWKEKIQPFPRSLSGSAIIQYMLKMFHESF